MTYLYPFHLALPVANIEVAKEFYVKKLGLSQGREDKTWVDINFFGHQLVFHKAPTPELHYNGVDKKDVPVPHFGCVLDWKSWHDLKDKLIQLKINFVIEPYIRFEGQPGEQATMFFLDPNGLALEFKSFKDMGQLFTVNS